MKAAARSIPMGVVGAVAVVLTMVGLLAQTPSPAPKPTALVIESPALKHDQPMPRDYTPDGRNISPPLTWSGAPAGTREFALILEDPDAGSPPPYVHWLIYKIPATANGLPENVPIDAATPMPASIGGAMQGVNGFRRNIYRGPAPPPGRPHHYHFIVYALDTALNLQPGLTRQQLLDAMKGHVIAVGEIVATYQREGSPEGAAPAGAAPARGRGRGRGF